MSRGFVKEGDQEELPVIPPRAPLPPGAINYVTPAGYDALLQERDALEEERKALPRHNETEYRHAATVIDGKLKLLNERIATARVLEPAKQPQDEVRFGAIVKFRNGDADQQFQITGVDEADIRLEKIAFTAPLARALTGKRVGDVAEFRRKGKTQKLKILSIRYAEG